MVCRQPTPSLHLQGINEEHTLNDVKAVQQLPVRLALLFRHAGLEALPRLEGHGMHLREFITSSEASFKTTAVPREQRKNGRLVRLKACTAPLGVSSTMTMVKPITWTIAPALCPPALARIAEDPHVGPGVSPQGQ